MDVTSSRERRRSPITTSESTATVRIEEYEAGHMMYIHERPLAEMRADIPTFYAETKAMQRRGEANVPGDR